MKEKIVEIKKDNGIAIVHVLETRLYQNSVVPFQDELVAIIDQGNAQLIVDLSEVDVINSSGLGVLILVSDRLKKSGGKLVVTGLQPLLNELFYRMHLDALFVIAETLEEALSAMR